MTTQRRKNRLLPPKKLKRLHKDSKRPLYTVLSRGLFFAMM